ncbi:uncharacterized protein [Miscanthus floridulus]|uniref:uncharacterized protein n=1 Tax=Miscanthus floridulus TaxID=154761 RepID=UPI003459BAA7
MKWFLFRGSNKGEHRKEPKLAIDDAEGKDGGFLMLDGCLMIFKGLVAYDSKHRQKLACCEVYTTEIAEPSFLRWLESTITFDWTDHPKSVPQPGRYPLMVDSIIGTKRLTKVLMDGGSGLNIMYTKTLDAMGIDQSCIRPTKAPFHGIVPRKQAVPLGMQTLTFKVVGFHGTYHTILGHPCYMKFMAVPNYIYLKLKMLGPCKVITIDTSFQHAYKCEVECYEHAMAIVTSKELVAIREEESTLTDFLHANRDIFVWRPIDMRGILRKVTEHALKIKLGSKPVKQCLCRFDREKRWAIGEETVKLLVAGFIKEVYHPEWLANHVLA